MNALKFYDLWCGKCTAVLRSLKNTRMPPHTEDRKVGARDCLGSGKQPVLWR